MSLAFSFPLISYRRVTCVVILVYVSGFLYTTTVVVPSLADGHRRRIFLGITAVVVPSLVDGRRRSTTTRS